MATVYKHNDAGAPTYLFSSSTSSPLHFTALKAILKACLVYGYGSKPSAGWDLLDEGDTYLVLRPATQSGVLILQMSFAAGIMTVSVAANYLGLTGGVPTGDGLKTGVEANNAAPQRLSLAYFASNSNYHSWSLIADDKTFVLNQGGYPGDYDYIDGSTVTDRSCLPLYAGEDTNGNFIAVGGHNSAGGSSFSSHAFATFGFGGVSALRYPATGLLIGNASANIWMPLGRTRIQLQISRVPPSPIPKYTNAQLCGVPWFESGVQGGYLRGISILPDYSEFYPGHVAQALGRPASVSVKVSNAHLSLDLGDEYQYIPTQQSYYSSPRIITDNPRFW